MIGYGAWEAGGDAWGPNESEAASSRRCTRPSTRASTGSTRPRSTADGVSETPGRRGHRRDGGTTSSCLRRSPPDRKEADSAPRRSGRHARTAWSASVPTGSTCISSIGPTRRACRSRRPGEPWRLSRTKPEGRYIGVSNFDREQIERCLAIRHVDSLQPEFSMLTREHAELIRWCGEAGRRRRHLRSPGVRAADRRDHGRHALPTRRLARREAADGPFADLARSLAVVERLVPSPNASGARCPSSRSPGTSTSPASRPRSPGAATRRTFAPTPPRATSSWTTATLAELDAILGLIRRRACRAAPAGAFSRGPSSRPIARAGSSSMSLCTCVGRGEGPPSACRARPMRYGDRRPRRRAHRRSLRG